MTGLDGIEGISLETNISDRFESRFPTLKVNKTNSLFFNDMEDTEFGIWSAHKEGRFFFENPNVVELLIKNNMIPLQYCDENGINTQQYPLNPNGSPEGIAAIQSLNGRHLAMMPHPERSFLKWQIPWLCNNGLSYTTN